MDRQIQTVFCDDIRHELGGKLSYIGVYSGMLFVPIFPATLSKLCLATNVLTPADRPFAKLTVRLLKDEDVLVEGTMDDAQLSAAVDLPTDDAMAKDRIRALQSIIVFSPFVLEGPCTLRVRAETEEGELRGLGLRVEQAPARCSRPALCRRVWLMSPVDSGSPSNSERSSRTLASASR